METSKRIRLLGKGVFARNDLRKIAYRKNLRRSSEAPLIDLSLGSTDLPPPSLVIDEIRKEINNPQSYSYCLHGGTRPFREAVSDWAMKRFSVRVDPDKEVLLLTGSQEGIAHLPLAVMNQGDRGLVLDPAYPAHRGGLLLANAKIKSLTLHQVNNWKPSFTEIANSEWQQLRLMILGFPHNPTACVGEQSWLDEAMAIGLRNNCVVAHDNPYVDLALEGEAPVLLHSDGWRAGGIEFFSFSKAWCMGGLRIAFAIGAEPLISALRDLKGVVDFNNSLALQRGAITALSEVPSWPCKILKIYRERRDVTFNALDAIGWKLPIPSMAIYLWIPIPEWAKDKGLGDESLAADLLEKTGVALTPGSGFGPAGTDWLRMALVRPVDELEIAVEKIGAWWRLEN